MKVSYIFAGIVCSAVTVFLVIVLYATMSSKSAIDDINRIHTESKPLMDCEFKYQTEAEKIKCLNNT